MCLCVIILFVIIVNILDVLVSGIWEEIGGAQDQELQSLAKGLQATVFSSRADSTTKKYAGAYRRWKQWALGKGFKAFPVKVAEVSLYLQYVGENSGSAAAVVEAVNAIAWAQRMAGSESLISNEVFIKAVVDGFQRRYAKPKKRKEPITPEGTMGSSPTLSEVRVVMICLLAYAAFLRFDEVAKLRCCDVGIKQDRMDIVINYSKTDQYRQGAVVPIARSGLCAMMELYWRLGSISGSSEEKLF